MTSARRRGRQAFSLLLAIAVCVFTALALRDSWGDVRRALRELRWTDLALSTVAGLAASWAMYRTWRAVLEALHGDGMTPHDLRAMFFCSQLGKYAPGSVWPAVIQTEIGAKSGVRRPVVLTSYGLSLIVGLSGGGLLAGGVLLGDVPRVAMWGALAAVAGGVLLGVALVHPSGLGKVADRLLSRAGASREVYQPDFRTMLPALGWSVVGWLLIGLHAWFLARPFGASVGDLVFVAASFVLAWVAGIAALPLPAGAGVREAVLVVTLGRLIGQPAAISVALTSRLVMIVLDVGLSVVAGLPRVLRDVKAHRAAATATD